MLPLYAQRIKYCVVRTPHYKGVQGTYSRLFTLHHNIILYYKICRYKLSLAILSNMIFW